MKNIRRTTCENCGAPYAIDVSRLRKEENKVTCRRCKHKMIIYKSGSKEPTNEHTIIENEDEKTQVDDGPMIQQDAIPFETAISKNPPPFSMSESSGDSLGDIKPDPRVPSLDISPPPKKIAVSPTELGGKKPPPSPNTNAVLQKDLHLCAGLITLAILGMFGQIYFQGETTPLTISVLVSVGSSLFALFTLVTSSFGRLPSQMLMSAGISIGLTSVLSAALFMGPLALSSAGDDTEVSVMEEASKEDEVEKSGGRDSSKEDEKKEIEKKDVSTKEGPSKRKKSKKESSRKTDSIASSSSKEKTSYDEIDPKIEPVPEVIDELDLPSDPDELLDEEIVIFDEDPEPDKRSSRKDRKSKDAPSVTVPPAVLDTIIRTNGNVKQCFIDNRKRTGDLPKDIEVIFTLQPSGKVSKVYITDGPYVGSTFESCLRSAFKSMSFPKFDDAATAQQLRYEFSI